MAGTNAAPSAVEKSAEEALAAFNSYKKKRDTKSPDEKKLEGEVKGILGIIGTIVKLLGSGATEIENIAFDPHVVGVMNHMVTLMGNVENWMSFAVNHKSLAINEAVEGLGSGIFSSLIEDSMDIHIDGGGGQSAAAVKTIKRVLGFCLILPYATAGLSFAGRLLLGERFPETINDSLGRLGEELGLNFMLGTLLENIFEQATGRPLEEAINQKVHPNRLDMMTIRALARQHQMNAGDFHDALDKLGYPDNLKELIFKLDDSQLSPSDLQAAYLTGMMKEGDVSDYLTHLGYSDTDIGIITNNYIKHAETGAKSVYRTAARRSFIDEHMDEGTFRGILSSLGDQPSSIDMEVSAAKLSQSASQHHQTVSSIKQLYQHGILQPDAAKQQLAELQYTDAEISNLMKLWDDGPKKANKNMPVGRILGYVAGGVMPAADAVGKLVNMGYKPDDANFLVNNPRTLIHGAKSDRKPSTVVQAVREGLLGVGEATSILQDLKLNQSEIDLEMRIASYQYNSHHKKVPGSRTLSSGEVHQIVKAGLAGWGWAEGYLESIGYSPMDATMLASVFTDPISLPNGVGSEPLTGGSGSGSTDYGFLGGGGSLGGVLGGSGNPVPIGRRG